MVSADLATVLVAVAVAFGTAAITLVGATILAVRRFRQSCADTLLAEGEASVAFLFDDETLVDATPAAKAILASSPEAGSDWIRLTGLLRHRFPGLDSALSDLAQKGRIDLSTANGGGEKLRAEWRDGFARIVILDDLGGRDEIQADRHTHAAMEAELQVLRSLLRSGPTAIWKQDEDGTITWANEVYFDLVEDVLGSEGSHSWPPAALFPISSDSASEQTGVVAPFRATLRPSDARSQRWFECRGHKQASEMLCYATPADNVVRAEEALREFVQTLSKTFADLPIGLAIFDRSRKLALFNPALTDLTTLEIEFLSSRPTLFAFLDKLREHRRIPEQRDYQAWRKRMTELEKAATNGFVQENWTLPTGQTFRVTGRPHPDGAVAFLFEDISAEISLTRRFRSEIELGQTVIDSLDEAIAVFSSAGTLIFSNTAYAKLWGIDPAVTLAEINVHEATRLWQSCSEPTPVWGDARDFLAIHGEREEWTATVCVTDGPQLACRFQPLTGGSTLVGFTELEGAKPKKVEISKHEHETA